MGKMGGDVYTSTNFWIQITKNLTNREGGIKDVKKNDDRRRKKEKKGVKLNRTERLDGST